jgi:hypothetical protein
MFLLTIFLKHDQTRTLAEIQAHLEETGYFDQLQAKRKAKKAAR